MNKSPNLFLFALISWTQLSVAQDQVHASGHSTVGHTTVRTTALTTAYRSDRGRRRAFAAGRTCPAEPGLSLRLVLFDSVGLSPKVTVAMRRSATQIFERIQVRIEWTEHEQMNQDSVPVSEDDFKVIVLPAEPTAWKLPADTMGAVFRSDTPTSTIFLFDPAIRHTLTRLGRRGRFMSDDKTGVAYGRILAHEIVHALAPDETHAKSGLMAGAQDRHGLVARRLRLDAASIAAVCRTLRQRIE